MKQQTIRALIRSIVIGRRPGGLDRKKITRYRQALRQGDTFPPIGVIKHRPGCYEVLDGYHRFHAHRLEGRKTIRISVVVE
jgi:ParB-like chromosome segregation protein Spo0J